VTVPSSDAGGLPLDLDQIEAKAKRERKDLRRLPATARWTNDLIAEIDDQIALVARVRALEAEAVKARALAEAKDRALKRLAARNGALEAEVQQLQEQNGRLEAWRATSRAFSWKGTF
jgi:chromosome segregation ATPase